MTARRVTWAPARPQPLDAARRGSRAALFEAVALAAILALALVVRIREASVTPFWFDELFTLGVARVPVREALGVLRQDMHPPLYFLAVSGWRALVGEGEVALRLPSIAAGVATVAVTWALGREVFGPRAGLLAALLLALHRSQVASSVELRSWAWLWLLQTLAVWSALRWVRHARRRDAAGYVMAATLALWTHYLALMVLPVVGLWGLLALRKTPGRAAAWIGINLVPLALFAPQVPTMLAQMGVNVADHWVTRPGLADLLEWARVAGFGATYLAAAGAVLVALAFTDRRTRGAAALLAMVAFVPVIAAWLLTRQGMRLFTVRYMLHGMPLFCALMTGGIASLTPLAERAGGALGLGRGAPAPAGSALPVARGVAAIAGVLLVVLAARSLALKQPHAEAMELARAAAWLQPRLRPGDVVYSAESHGYLFLRHYQPRPARQRLLLSDPDLPYYEAARIIPAGERATLEDFGRTLATGGRWFGVRVHHVGMDGDSVAARFQAAAGAPRIQGTLVSVWTTTP